MEWLIYASIAVIFSSFSVILQKKSVYHEHPFEFVTLFCIWNFLFTLPSLNKINLHLPTQTYFLIVCASLIMFIHFFLFGIAISKREVSEVIPLLSFSMLFSVFLSFIFLGEELKIIDYLGIIMIFCGAFVLESGKSKLKSIWHHFKKKYVFITLLAAFFLAIYYLLIKVILSPGIRTMVPDATTLLFFTRFFIMITCLFFLFFLKSKARFIHIIKNKSWYIIPAALFANMSIISYYKAQTLTLLSNLIPVLNLSTLTTTLLGLELFHEHKLWQKIIASILMVVGTYFLLL